MKTVPKIWFAQLDVRWRGLMAVFMLGAWCIGGLCGCASSAPQVQGDTASAVSEELEALKQAAESSYDRERAMAERLQLAEASKRGLEAQLGQLQERLVQLEGRLDTLKSDSVQVPPIDAVRSDGFEVMKAYRTALDNYRARHFDRALLQFAEILMAAPYSDWADNAQYWTGECYYGLGKYRQALAEFTKVFAFRKTEKADHAQLKIAYCYLALGERKRALSSFQKLLDEYPESEKAPIAHKEIQYLQ